MLAPLMWVNIPGGSMYCKSLEYWKAGCIVCVLFHCGAAVSMEPPHSPFLFKSDKTSCALQLWPPGALNSRWHVACELVRAPAAAAAGRERGGQGGECRRAAGGLCVHPRPVVRGQGSSREGRGDEESPSDVSWHLASSGAQRETVVVVLFSGRQVKSFVTSFSSSSPLLSYLTFRRLSQNVQVWLRCWSAKQHQLFSFLFVLFYFSLLTEQCHLSFSQGLLTWFYCYTTAPTAVFSALSNSQFEHCYPVTLHPAGAMTHHRLAYSLFVCRKKKLRRTLMLPLQPLIDLVTKRVTGRFSVISLCL